MTLTILSSCLCAGLVALSGAWYAPAIAAVLVIVLVAGSQESSR